MDTLPFPCPRDGAPLAAAAGPEGRRWACGSCGGQAVAVAVLRQTAARAAFRAVWAAVEAAAPGGLACPGCGREMAQVGAAGASVDICRSCQLFWFDDGERAAVAPPPPPPAALPAEAAAALAAMEAEQAEARAAGERWAAAGHRLSAPVRGRRQRRLDGSLDLWEALLAAVGLAAD
jgi:hypothetical protein